MFEVNITQYIVDENFILKSFNANMMVNSLIIQPHYISKKKPKQTMS